MTVYGIKNNEQMQWRGLSKVVFTGKEAI